MHSDKKLTKEDTWRPADLRRYIGDGYHDEEYVRSRGGTERKHRGGESTERRQRDPERESKREKEKTRESTRERKDEDRKYAGRQREGSQDRRGDKERDREKRRERDRLVDDDMYGDSQENRIRRREREEKHDKDRERERHRDGERERMKERDRHREDRDNRREDRDRERRREERDREHKSERDRGRHDESREKRRDEAEKNHGEQRDRHRERDRHRNEDKEIQEEHRQRKHSERKEEREYNEEYRKHKEERERRHKDRRPQDEKRKQDSESKENQDMKGLDDGPRHHRGDRERADKERRHREDRDADRKHRERRHREEEDQEGKHRERRHKEENEEGKHRERRHKEENEEGKHRERRNKEENEEVKHRERRHKEENEEVKHRDRRHRDEEEKVQKYGERRERNEEDTERKHSDRKDWDQERDPERNDKDRPSSKKSSSDKSPRPEMDKVETEVVKDEDLADQEYEDDFEDYEEDFEEMDESANEGEDEEEPANPEAGEEREEITAQQRKEIQAIQKAIDEENERVGTAQSRQNTITEEEERPKRSEASEKKESGTSQRGRFIDFVAAKKREVSQKVATKQKKRGTELLRLIDLDFSMTFSLLDLPPVNEYDMYIRSFGTANTKQAYVQCNEDNVERDIQTEEIEMCEKWTQHPPDHRGACGDPNLSQEASREMSFDSQRLALFLRSASQVMVVLLEEDRAERKSQRKLKTQTDSMSFSDGSLQLNTKLPFLYGRQVSLLHFSQVQRHTMLSVHRPTTEPSAVRLDSCSLICIWNIWEPSRPQKILVYESEVQCCCFSPGKAILVFAGTSVGSVVLWDLREQAGNHYSLKIGKEEWTFRQPTFSTDAVMGGSGHFSSVTSIEVVPSPVAEGLRPEVPLLASEEESLGLSFQLASLDESGVLNFWVVVELPKGNEAGSPVDLGLRPGGKVKLLHSSSLLTAERASPRDAVKTGPLQTLLLRFLPTDSNHFFIGTNMGLVNHGASHGLKAPPKFYRFQEVEVRPTDVTSMHFSPFKQHLFLVGCSNGSIRLHAVSHEQPVAEWMNSTAGEPVVSLQWNQTRPTVFCVLDAASNLYIWDLLKNDAEPVISERMDADRVTAMSVFGDSGQQNPYSGIALAHDSGKIEVQYFIKTLTVSSPAEENKLESLKTEAF